MKTLTIFTPAYNRAHTIGRTYESLKRQTCKDFEWLIVDDGSTDNTVEIVKPWIDEADFKIRYIRQENQGMHGAHNTAYDNITTELNTCIDSDDWMPDDAVEKIVKFWHSLPQKDRRAGIVGLDIKENGELIGTKFRATGIHTTYCGFMASDVCGDKKLVYRTDVINKYPKYPLFVGERYVGLAYKYMLIDRDYELITLNEPLVIVEYQDDGSSMNMYNQYWKNPIGFSFLRHTEMVYAKKLSRQFISCVHYVATSIISKNFKLIQHSPRPWLTLCALPMGLLWYGIIKYKVKKGGKYKLN